MEPVIGLHRRLVCTCVKGVHMFHVVTSERRESWATRRLEFLGETQEVARSSRLLPKVMEAVSGANERGLFFLLGRTGKSEDGAQ